MPERKNNGILSIIVKELLNVALILQNKLEITVTESVVHYMICSSTYLKRQLA